MPKSSDNPPVRTDPLFVVKSLCDESEQDKSVAVDKEKQVSECVYYQWDTIQQRLHIIQKRPPSMMKTVLPNGYEALVYKAHTINSRGQLDDAVSDFSSFRRCSKLPCS